ncbi:5-(carboxyamino)imidazole ribonucleotide synthase [Phreatobacter aquaticus]|uniref:N5-carboxyaminoimidazole ribonucleotide synthase n=1 Tax=Phreatobacter aquaticus TaxID=2570229 RepID=A0A4D7QL66_9HYPH|nr:5-(carboxyamino)imidazole ribonucleotide synthase [Phreatobacter aquaticus]QCK88470.1 5-(carboxyamino)imidazole ribonucleotide synthase [Phreatobacter aquaticus]
MSERSAGPQPIVGILGGGQLGRMLAMAGARLGLRCQVLAPEPESPAFDVVRRVTQADYSDEVALARFAEDVDIVTYEFENVPDKAARFLSSRLIVRPGPRALAVSQDRVIEKTFARDCGLSVPDFAPVDDLDGLERALARLGRPAVLKTRRFGYDGKGQAVIREGDDAASAFSSIGRQPAILEAFVPFVREISVIVVRGADGEIRHYDPVENVHSGGILRTSTVPARITPELAAEAARMGETLAEKLDYVGVLAVELFVTADGRLMVNEMAPRVHNSGHWTEAACHCSQFENHMRAVAGLPLGSTKRHSDAVMQNLIGADVEAWSDIAAEEGAVLHLYGKRDQREGRKMGHVTRLLPLSPG